MAKAVAKRKTKKPKAAAARARAPGIGWTPGQPAPAGLTLLPIEQLKGGKAPYNPREIAPEEFESLKQSLQRWGAVEWIVWNTRSATVVGGHQRIDAASDLGWTAFPTLLVDLDDTDEIALNLALNRIRGKWQWDRVAELLRALPDDDARLRTGFRSEEIDQLLDSGFHRSDVTTPELHSDATPGGVGSAVLDLSFTAEQVAVIDRAVATMAEGTSRQDAVVAACAAAAGDATRA